MKIVLIGGYPKGYDEPFHIKTTSGRILRKIVSKLKITPIYFDIWNTKEEEDLKIVSQKTKDSLQEFKRKGYNLISLGRYIEKVIKSLGIETTYLPHPASRDIKYIKLLEKGLRDLSN